MEFLRLGRLNENRGNSDQEIDLCCMKRAGDGRDDVGLCLPAGFCRFTFSLFQALHQQFQLYGLTDGRRMLASRSVSACSRA
jgi:hypothetical protein